MSDQVTDALERLRSEYANGPKFQMKLSISDLSEAAQYALAATDERLLTREWLEVLLGSSPQGSWSHGGKVIRLASRGDGLLYAIGYASHGAIDETGIATPADAIAFFQLTRWPVSRQRIVEAWRKMG